MAHVVVNGLIKKFGEFEAVHGVDFEIGDGEFAVLVGPSGCGKSTILRMIAGLETITGGTILIDEQVVNNIPPRDRDIAMVFQDYALYPHMSVRQNLGFGLKMRGTPRPKIEAAVQKTAQILQIEELLDRKPKELSGGQRQRVAIGRAIAREPVLFLFDEPLSNLDAKLRVEMRTQIKRLHMAFKTTSIYVTHDQTEAMTLADRIVALRNGHIEQIGTPSELYAKPRNLFVAGFIGSPTMNFLPARLAADNGALLVLL
jgi:multiple sugar transport system ATP-binding protein